MYDDIFDMIKHHVSILKDEISQYFLDVQEFEKYYFFIRSSFMLFISNLLSEDNLVEEQFIDLVNDGDAKYSFHEMFCCDFWIQMAPLYPDVAKIALKLLIPFPTTYECEKGF